MRLEESPLASVRIRKFHWKSLAKRSSQLKHLRNKGSELGRFDLSGLVFLWNKRSKIERVNPLVNRRSSPLSDNLRF